MKTLQCTLEIGHKYNHSDIFFKYFLDTRGDVLLLIDSCTTTGAKIVLRFECHIDLPVVISFAERAQETTSMGNVMGSRADPQNCVQNLQPRACMYDGKGIGAMSEH